MKKKGVGCLLALMLAAMTFSGCGGKKQQQEPESGPKETQQTQEQQTAKGHQDVKLKFWCDEDESALFQEMINAFIEEHKDEANIEVEYEMVGASACKDTIVEDVNNAADFFSMPDDQLRTLVAAGVLEEIPDGDMIAERNLEGASEAASLNGKMFAYPVTADNGYFLFYDKDYFTEEDVKTLDQILEVCEKKKKKFVMDWSSGWYLYSFFGNTGMSVGLNEDGLTNHCDWNSTENAIKGVDVAKSLLQISSSPAFKSSGEFPKEAKKNAIAIVSGVWDINAIKEAYGEDYGACKLPTFTCKGKQIQMASFTGYRLIGVNAYSPNREWAEKIAEYLTNEENQNLRFERSDRGPSNKNAAASDAVGKIPAIKAVLEQSEFGTLQKIGPRYWTPTSDFGKIMVEGNPSNLPLQELLDQMVAKMTE